MRITNWITLAKVVATTAPLTSIGERAKLPPIKQKLKKMFKRMVIVLITRGVKRSPVDFIFDSHKSTKKVSNWTNEFQTRKGEPCAITFLLSVWHEMKYEGMKVIKITGIVKIVSPEHRDLLQILLVLFKSLLPQIEHFRYLPPEKYQTWSYWLKKPFWGSPYSCIRLGSIGAYHYHIS